MVIGRAGEITKRNFTAPVSYSTIIFSQSPFFTRINPTTDLMASSILIIKNIHTIGRLVKCASSIATGTFTAHIKPLSKIKVITVLPPLLRVKYAALVKALNGVARTYTQINLVARITYFSGCVIYTWEQRCCNKQQGRYSKRNH